MTITRSQQLETLLKVAQLYRPARNVSIDGDRLKIIVEVTYRDEHNTSHIIGLTKYAYNLDELQAILGIA